MTKQYLLKLMETGDGVEEQDAIEWAIFNNWITLSGNLERDKVLILQAKPEIVTAFRRVLGDYEAAIEQTYES